MNPRWSRLLPVIVASTAGLASSYGQQIAFSVPSASATEATGTAIVRIHDFDFDGTADLVVGAPGFDCGVLTNCGAARIVSGADGSTLATATGGSALERFGAALAAIDDVNADGVPDVAVGAPGFGGANPTGAIRILSGASFAVIGIVVGPTPGSRIGERVLRLADQTGDGKAEIASGGRGASPNGISGAGSVYVFDSSTGAIAKQFDGASAFEAFGTDVATIRDITGDLREELVIGSPGDDPFGNNGAGSITVIDPVSGIVLRVVFGLNANDGLGSTCAGLDDLDADGFPDLLGGAPGATVAGLSLAGSAIVFSFVSGAVITRVDGQAANDMSGRVVARLSDLDRDGVMDYAIGSPSWSLPGKPSAGRISVFSGKTKTLLYRFDGASAGAEFGGFIGPLGDLNGDARQDFAIGWPAQDTPFADGGVARIHRGQSPALTIASTGQTGTPFLMELIGKASSPAFVLAAGAAGATPTPFGLLQLALMPTPMVIPLGAFSLEGALAFPGTVPALGIPGAATIHLQAANLDPHSFGGGWLGQYVAFTVFP